MRVCVREAVTCLLYTSDFKKATRHRNQMKTKKVSFVSDNAALCTETEKEYP